MLKHSLLALTTTALIGNAVAQNCNDNVYTAHLVSASGTELPTFYDPVVQSTSYQSATEDVFLAFDPTIPSGVYYVHVTDNPVDGLDEVVSTNDPLDRFVAVTNTGGVITLSLPYSGNPGNQEYGAGLNGVGQSLRLHFGPSQYTQCRFKVWLGDHWDLTGGPANPYLVRSGIHPTTGVCSIRSYTSLRVGDGSGSDVLGCVFDDANGNGVRDVGEAGLPNWQVRLAGGPAVLTTLTDADGKYRFDNVGAGSFSVELTVQQGWAGTTPLAYAIESCACATMAGGDFGVKAQVFQCNARTIGYWRNQHGLARVQHFNILPTLPSLFIVGPVLRASDARPLQAVAQVRQQLEHGLHAVGPARRDALQRHRRLRAPRLRDPRPVPRHDDGRAAHAAGRRQPARAPLHAAVHGAPPPPGEAEECARPREQQPDLAVTPAPRETARRMRRGAAGSRTDACT
jgi:hypothetical protein